MAGETTVTVVGNLTGDPELRFTPSGAAVTNFTVASTPRKFNKQTNEWEDQETWFVPCAVWRQAAENVAESLAKGDRVIVQGRLGARSFEDRDGNKRTVVELQVDEVGPSLARATAKVTKAGRTGGQQGNGWSANQPNGGQQAQDPWANQGGQDPWAPSSNNNDAPPF